MCVRSRIRTNYLHDPSEWGSLGYAPNRTGVALQKTGGVRDRASVVLQRTGGALDRTCVAFQRNGCVLERNGGALDRTCGLGGSWGEGVFAA